MQETSAAEAEQYVIDIGTDLFRYGGKLPGVMTGKEYVRLRYSAATVGEIAGVNLPDPGMSDEEVDQWTYSEKAATWDKAVLQRAIAASDAAEADPENEDRLKDLANALVELFATEKVEDLGPRADEESRRRRRSEAVDLSALGNVRAQKAWNGASETERHELLQHVIGTYHSDDVKWFNRIVKMSYEQMLGELTPQRQGEIVSALAGTPQHHRGAVDREVGGFFGREESRRPPARGVSRR
jgi:hypothetical protein